MKGQLFISDVLVSLLIITMIISLTAWQLDQAYMRSPDIEYNQISFIASDMSQLAVKRILANVSGNQIQPNVLNESRWPLLTRNMSSMISEPYAYEASLLIKDLSVVSSNGGCDLRRNIAVSRRLVYLPDTAEIDTLIVKVCI